VIYDLAQVAVFHGVYGLILSTTTMKFQRHERPPAQIFPLRLARGRTPTSARVTMACAREIADQVSRRQGTKAIGHRFQNSGDGMRNARLKREDAFSHAMIIVSSAMVSSS
jgi:hypothetical protein